jgi:CubicO group peptidase (beta-lactamase class C family)
LNHSWAWAAGGAISNADDLATWIQALVSGRVFDAKHQQLWLDSLRPVDPKKPGQEYGYGIIALRWGTNAIYNHGGEMAGYQSFMGYDPANKITLIVWTNLTVSLHWWSDPAVSDEVQPNGSSSFSPPDPEQEHPKGVLPGYLPISGPVRKSRCRDALY